MARKAELERQITALKEEVDALRYKTTNHPREAIWLTLKPMAFNVGVHTVSDVAWAARAVVRDGRFSREEMIDFFLGSEEVE
ncbi:hypothetical protein SEA_ERENYEAGER_12 [Microbacterium phage Erenyeager]|nr:hypothetical protein SEA_ERENYEAGER_12 [Microbacterium phage Erenyeager]